MNRVESMFKAISEAKTGNYSMSYDETIALMERYSNKPINVIWDAYKYGFVKGQRAASNKMKKEGAVNV